MLDVTMTPVGLRVIIGTGGACGFRAAFRQHPAVWGAPALVYAVTGEVVRYVGLTQSGARGLERRLTAHLRNGVARPGDSFMVMTPEHCAAVLGVDPLPHVKPVGWPSHDWLGAPAVALERAMIRKLAPTMNQLWSAAPRQGRSAHKPDLCVTGITA